MSLNRARLHRLADERAADAAALLAAGRWSGAYCPSGDAVECGLKACIARLVQQHDFPEKRLARDSYTHDIERLLAVAGLKVVRDADVAANPARARHWATVRDWSEEARYDLWSEPKARAMFDAVTDPTHGILPWIRVRW